MVMLDRTFNVEERRTLTQDKRLVLVDPGGTRKESGPCRSVCLTLPLFLRRHFSGRLLLWDKIQTFPGSSPVSVFVQL